VRGGRYKAFLHLLLSFVSCALKIVAKSTREFKESRGAETVVGLSITEFEAEFLRLIPEAAQDTGREGGGMSDDDDWESAWDSGVSSLFSFRPQMRMLIGS